MFNYISGTGKEFKLGNFSFICHIEDYFEEMDRLEDDPIAVCGKVFVELFKNGEFIGEYVDIDIAYDKASGFDLYSLDDEFIDACGNSLNEEAVFGDKLPQVYCTLLSAIKSACENIEPKLKDFIDEIEQEY